MENQKENREIIRCLYEEDCKCLLLRKAEQMRKELEYLRCERDEVIRHIHSHNRNEEEIHELRNEINRLRIGMANNQDRDSSTLHNISLIVRDIYDGKIPVHESDFTIPVSSFRTTSLFHYTKHLVSLKKILEDGLIPNFCSEDLLPGLSIGIPMVSFCDIPLSRTHFHTSQYGSYAIGLATEYGETNNINPVFYVASSEMMEKIVRWPHSSIQIEKFFNNPTSPFYKKMFGTFEGKEVKNYAENEWRYVVPQSRDLRWMKSMDEYKKWRRSGEGGKKPNPVNRPELYDSRLRFDVRDVNYIIVRNESEVRDMAEYILGLNSLGGSGTSLNEADKIYLITRIISFERIRRDF